MGRPATTRLKVNPPLGRMPVLQFVPPSELYVDETYQRSLDAGPSQTLIRKIAQFWNWDLCQPLVVARREGGKLFVIDGQHRLEAAKMRGDIGQLPCVVVDYACAADEAASFVHLNQQRRPLTKLDVFKAAVASEDPEALAIVRALSDANLSVAPHSNYTAWKPGMVSHIGGIEEAWRKAGERVTRCALVALAQAFEGEKLRYAGTIWPGIWKTAALGATSCELAEVLRFRDQNAWSKLIIRLSPDMPGGRREAAQKIIGGAWEQRKKAPPAPARAKVVDLPPAQPADDGRKWCEQCEQRVTLSAATLCKSQFCKVRPRLRA